MPPLEEDFAALTLDKISASVCSYGRKSSMARCALRSFAEATSFIAEVIFSVLRTDPILSLISLKEAMTRPD